MNRPKVFISYSHDSPNHSDRVLQFAWKLRDFGIDADLDQFHTEEILDWPRWCRQQIKRESSDIVLCICTLEYQNRIEGAVPPEKGKGVYWEGSLLDDEVYDAKGNRRIIPILFDNEPETSILDFLRGWTRCRINQFELSDFGFKHLIRILTKQASVEKNPLGNFPILSTKHATTSQPTSTETEAKADISRIFKYAPAELIGRDVQLKLLNEAWGKIQAQETPRARVLTFFALGGEGKTSLVAKWAAELAGQDWPGCDAAFAWSFYSQGTRDQVAASSDLFLKEALNFFAKDEKDKEFAASSAGAFEKGQRLARLVGQQRSLLILDGLEPLQYAPTAPTPGELKDQGITALLKGLSVFKLMVPLTLGSTTMVLSIKLPSVRATASI
ncbi:MAG: TIR domain-containing protein, partial [Nitrosomonadaceae bacterium]|nr:TIR domain-containing protein [Nitrosomonadaceae bacterium]